MNIRTRGEPRVGIQFEGEIVSSPGCVEVVATLIIGAAALSVIFGFW